MAAQFGLFFLILGLALPLNKESERALIVWNVGQGLWTTVQDANSCWHFDMGGEFLEWSAVAHLCRARHNLISLSHWDMDHIGFLKSVIRHLPDVCMLAPPVGVASVYKRHLVERIPRCRQRPPYSAFVDEHSHTANGKSRVIEWQGILFPGDSTVTEEKVWSASELLNLRSVHVLILGHHGSRTSTSKNLLEHIPSVKMAIASARFRRYGHPHAQLVERLMDFKIPLLRTEEWGNIHIELE